jgi:hypothetical protein
MQVLPRSSKPLCILGLFLTAGCSGSSKPSTPPPARPVAAQLPPVTVVRNTPTGPPVMMQFAPRRPANRALNVNTADGSAISIHISTSPGADPTNPYDSPTQPEAVNGSLTNSEGQHAAVDATESPAVTIPNSSLIEEVLTDDDPDDQNLPDLSPTEQEIEVLRPEADQYTLQVKGFEHGVYSLEIYATGPDSNTSHFYLQTVPAHPGSLFELHMVCRRMPSFEFELTRGGLQPPHGAFSFAQPLASEVRLSAEDKALAVVILYDPGMDPTSFRASLDGSDRTSLFHVRPGEIELVFVPLDSGQHDLTIRANDKAGLSTEQEFHIQH